MKELIKYQNLALVISFTAEQLTYLDSLSPLHGSEWYLDSKEMLAIKETIKTQLNQIQGCYCIYCGISNDIVGSLEREHIAPKNARKYPQFMFEPYNLVLACHTCNGSTRKGKIDTISKLDNHYAKCTFTIIHPYFDRFEDHILFKKKDDSIVLDGLTQKGSMTIMVFDLNNEGQLSIRGQMLNIEKYRVSDKNEKIIDEILSKNYST